MESRNNEVRALEQDWTENPRWKGVKRGYSAEDVVRLRGSLHIEHTLARAAPKSSGSCMQRDAVREFARRAHRQPGDAAGEGRRARDLPLRLAGRGRRERLAADVSRPVALCGFLRAHGRASASTTRFARADQIQRWKARASIDCFAPIVADAEVGLRRRAQRLRADEVDDRGRRRRRALRGPARLGEEMRPHGRQGAGADAGSGAEADRRAARGRRAGRADGAARAHRRRSRRPRHHRRRRERQAVPHRRAHVGRLLPHAEGLRPGAFARPRLRANTPTWCGARPARRISASPADSPRASAEVPRQDARLQLLAVVQLEDATSTTRPSPSSSASWARWATSSSSSRSPASTRSTTRCSSSRTATRATT